MKYDYPSSCSVGTDSFSMRMLQVCDFHVDRMACVYITRLHSVSVLTIFMEITVAK